MKGIGIHLEVQRERPVEVGDGVLGFSNRHQRGSEIGPRLQNAGLVSAPFLLRRLVAEVLLHVPVGPEVPEVLVHVQLIADPRAFGRHLFGHRDRLPLWCPRDLHLDVTRDVDVPGHPDELNLSSLHPHLELGALDGREKTIVRDLEEIERTCHLEPRFAQDLRDALAVGADRVELGSTVREKSDFGAVGGDQLRDGSVGNLDHRTWSQRVTDR